MFVTRRRESLARSTGVRLRLQNFQAYFGEVLPNFDRDRVHNSDIKKLLQWYDILVKAGITDFEPETEEAEGETAEEAATEE